MTDPTHDAVDAAAQAAYAYHYGDGMWRYLNEGMRKVWREDAAVYLTAAAPILRRAWADQAAARRAYELKVADLARETEAVETLARVLLDDNHSPDGFHAQGDRCRHCAALKKALRRDAPAAADDHPERTCGCCGGPNITWVAPSPLWNQVMRGGDINGTELHDGIVCPTCFAILAQQRGIAELWRLSAQRVHVPLQTITPSGRVWDEATWMWVDPPQFNEGALSVTCPTCGSAPGYFCIHQSSGNLRLPWHEARYRAAEAAQAPAAADEPEDRLTQALTSDMLTPNVRTAITGLLGDGVTVDPPLRQRLLTAAERGRQARRAAANAPAARRTNPATDQCLNCGKPIYLVTVPGGAKRWTHDRDGRWMTNCADAPAAAFSPDGPHDDVAKCPQCGRQSRSYSRGCEECGFGKPVPAATDEVTP